MIVPMKKVSLIIMGDKKAEALKKLRKLGIVHIEISEGYGEKLVALKDNISLLENALYILGKQKNSESKSVSLNEALLISKEIESFAEKKKVYQSKRIALEAELDRVSKLGEFDPHSIDALAKEGIALSIYEMPRSEYKKLDSRVKTITLSATKKLVMFSLFALEKDCEEEIISYLNAYRVELPKTSTAEMRQDLEGIRNELKAIDETIISYADYAESIKKAIKLCEQEIEFETYATGMEKENLSSDENDEVSVAYFKGYVEADGIDTLKQTARDNSWGLLVEEPTPEDNVPTKLKNNKLVSLIYPITDFLGTVPGYFEYDISGWFLSFILVFFGIIFGDGGYGLLICAAAAALIAKSLASKKEVPAAFWLIGLFGLSTVLWGTLTCTWLGLSPEMLPEWLKNLSIPVISNVYADKIWYPFWTQGEAGLTTGQNLQIFCFSLALVQLSVAHIKGAVRNRSSLKILGDIGSILQLLGIYYVVLSLVVNSAVFSFSLNIGGIAIGTVAIALIGVGFALSFAFANYEGSVIKSILASLTNIVSVLLGVVNVFSDIVSYIRLWAVGLAGAAISATVNELVGPLIGNFMFLVLAIILLVFGHGLNMILNVLSVIVHGIRLNTLEFSSHLDMSWSGHKFKPFKEQIDYKGE